MAYTSPAVVIDNGSYTTKAGFALDDLPSLVFSTNYAVNPNEENGKVIVGDDEIAKHPNYEVMTLMDNETIYNFDHIVDNWNYVYDNIDNHNAISAKDYPLVLTEPTWNSNKNKLATTQIAFETLEVPLFALVKTPLAQLYHMNRSSGLVIDIGSSTTSVTPILDGIIQTKSCFHNKFAGDFANLHALNFFHNKLGDDYLSKLIPSSFLTASQSFTNFYASHHILHDFKQSMLAIKTASPLMEAQLRMQERQYRATVNGETVDNEQPSNFQLSTDLHVPVHHDDRYKLLEPVFEPQNYPLPNITIPDVAMDKPQTHGLSSLALLSLKHLESTITSSMSNDNPASATQTMNSAYAKFSETLRDLFSNIVITGGGSLPTGVSDRIMEDLRRQVHTYFGNYAITQSYKLYSAPLRNYAAGDINNVWDKQFGSWLGACNLASMLNNDDGGDEENNGVNIALDNWFVTKADYEELGEDLILEKFK